MAIKLRRAPHDGLLMALSRPILRELHPRFEDHREVIAWAKIVANASKEIAEVLAQREAVEICADAAARCPEFLGVSRRRIEINLARHAAAARKRTRLLDADDIGACAWTTRRVAESAMADLGRAIREAKMEDEIGQRLV